MQVHQQQQEEQQYRSPESDGSVVGCNSRKTNVDASDRGAASYQYNTHHHHAGLSNQEHHQNLNNCMYDDISSLVIGSSLCSSQTIVAPAAEALDPTVPVAVGVGSPSVWPMTTDEEEYPSSLWDYNDPFFFDF